MSRKIISSTFELEELQFNELCKVLHGIETRLQSRYEELKKVLDDLNIQGRKLEAIGCNKSLRKYSNLIYMISKYEDWFSRSADDRFEDSIDKSTRDFHIKELMSALEFSRKIRSYARHYLIYGSAKISTGKSISFSTLGYVDVLNVTDKIIKERLRKLRNMRFDKKNKLQSNTEEKNNKKFKPLSNKSEVTTTNIEKYTKDLDQLKRDTIFLLYSCATNYENHIYNISLVRNEYQQKYDEILKMMTRQEKKGINLDDYSLPAIYKEVNKRIESNMIDHRYRYNEELDYTLPVNIMDIMELNTHMMTVEEISRVYRNMLVYYERQDGVKTPRNAQINFITLIHNRLTNYDSNKKLTLEEAVKICNEYLNSKILFKSDDFAQAEVKSK